MGNVYITGHRNPDLDSICSALAYADLKNLTDPAITYIPVRCSHLSESTAAVLKTLNITAPPYMRNVYPKVSDVMLSPEMHVEADSSLAEYAKLVSAKNPSAFPVFRNSEYAGLLSLDDVVLWAMERLAEKGEITSVPSVQEVMGEQGTILQADTLFEEGKNALLNSKKRGLAVFDGETFAGYVTRRCFLNRPKYDVILVDHNEASQSIKGIETANVTEIIDHHRLNAMKTSMPLFIDSEPLGSTCTIVYQLFLRNGIRPSSETARLLLSGIIADTLLLKSPTTTQTDIESAAALAAMCRINIEEYGRLVFSSTVELKNSDPLSVIASDFKAYSEKGVRFGIGQCEASTLQDLDEYAPVYISALYDTCRSESLDWALLMITDVFNEHSVLLSTAFRAEAQLAYSAISPHIYDLPGVMSRKKQLLPELLNALV